MTKRIVALLMALLLVLGCASVAAAEAPAELTICIMRRTTDITESYSQKHWVQDLEKACNVKITWIELLEGSHTEPLTALLAGNLPDVFWAGLSDAIISQNTSLWHVITEEEIKTYCPNLYNFYETYVDGWRGYMTYPDGNMYGFPGGKMISKMHTSQGLQWINTKWLERVNLDMPTTMDEFVNVLRAFRDQDANGNGDPNDEIPFDFCNNLKYAWLSCMAASWGLPIHGNSKVYYSWDENGNVIHAVDTPAFREFLEFFYQLGQEGLINMEGLSQSTAQYNANLNADKVGVFWGWGPCNYISDSELFLQFDAMVPTPAEGYKTVMFTRNLNFANAYRNQYVITRACKNVEKALEIWEWASEPTQALSICHGERFLFWDYVDENNNFLGEDATQEEIAACGYNMLVKTYPTDTPEEQAAYDALLTEWDYDWLVGKTFTGSNTTGLVNWAPLMLQSEGYLTDDLTVWGVQRYVAIGKYNALGAFCPYFMNMNQVSAEAKEEFDFMTDGLYNIIEAYVASSFLNGVTDASWDGYLKNLDAYGYNYYVDYYNNLYHSNP